MRIGIDGRYAQNQGGGINRYIYKLIDGIIKAGDTPVVYSNKRLPSKQKGAEYKVIPQRFHRIIWEQIQLPLAFKNLDLYHATANSGIPIFSNLPSILTIHDVIPLTQKGYFDNSKLPLISKLLYILSIRTSIYRSTKVICTTEQVLQDVKKHFRLSVKKAELIPMGVDKKFFESKRGSDRRILKEFGINSKFILNFGGIARRKNIEGLIKAFSSFVRKSNSKLVLVITGDSEQIGIYKDLAEKLNLQERIVFTGWVKYEMLPVLIRNAQFIVYPSFAEGFGLPLMEAMASRRPIVTSKRPSFLSMGRDIPIYINPKDPKSILMGMKMAEKGRDINTLIRGKKIARSYSWNKTLKKTYNIYSKTNYHEEI